MKSTRFCYHYRYRPLYKFLFARMEASKPSRLPCTCMPTAVRMHSPCTRMPTDIRLHSPCTRMPTDIRLHSPCTCMPADIRMHSRSEERRVGKECKSLWSAPDSKQNKHNSLRITADVR